MIEHTYTQRPTSWWQSSISWWHRQPPYSLALLLALLAFGILVGPLLYSFLSTGQALISILINTLLTLSSMVSLAFYATRLWRHYKQQGFSLRVSATLSFIILGVLVSLFLVLGGAVNINSRRLLTHEFAYGLFMAFTTGGVIGFAGRIFSTREKPTIELGFVRISAIVSIITSTIVLATNSSYIGSLSSIGIFSVIGIFPPIAITLVIVALCQYLGKVCAYFLQPTQDYVKNNPYQYRYTAIACFLGLPIAGAILLILLLSVNPFGGPALGVCISIMLWTAMMSLASKLGETRDQIDQSAIPVVEELPPDTLFSDRELVRVLCHFTDSKSLQFAKIHAYKVSRYGEDLQQGARLCSQALRKNIATLKSIPDDHVFSDNDQLIDVLANVQCIANAARSHQHTQITELFQDLQQEITRLQPLLPAYPATSSLHRLQKFLAQTQQDILALQSPLPKIRHDFSSWLEARGGMLNLINFTFGFISTTLSSWRKRFAHALRHDDDRGDPLGYWRILLTPFIIPALCAEFTGWILAILGKALTTAVAHRRYTLPFALIFTTLLLFSNPFSLIALAVVGLCAAALSFPLLHIQWKHAQRDHQLLRDLLAAPQIPNHDDIFRWQVENLISIMQRFSADFQQQTGRCFTQDLKALQTMLAHTDEKLSAEDELLFHRISTDVREAALCTKPAPPGIHKKKAMRIAAASVIFLLAAPVLLFSPGISAAILLSYYGFKFLVIALMSIGLIGAFTGIQQASAAKLQQSILIATHLAKTTAPLTPSYVHATASLAKGGHRKPAPDASPAAADLPGAGKEDEPTGAAYPGFFEHESPPASLRAPFDKLRDRSLSLSKGARNDAGGDSCNNAFEKREGIQI